MPKTYHEAVEQLGSRSSRKIANNTYLVKFEDTSTRVPQAAIAVKLHNTHVVTFYADGSIRLNSGGWRTRTTSSRMNEHTPDPYTVVSVKGKWLVRIGYGSDAVFVEYYDGITLPLSGPDSKVAQLATVKRNAARLNRQIGAYVRAYVKAFVEGDVEILEITPQVKGDVEHFTDPNNKRKLKDYGWVFPGQYALSAVETIPTGPAIVEAVRGILLGMRVDTPTLPGTVGREIVGLVLTRSLRRWIKREMGLEA